MILAVFRQKNFTYLEKLFLVEHHLLSRQTLYIMVGYPMWRISDATVLCCCRRCCCFPEGFHGGQKWNRRDTATLLLPFQPSSMEPPTILQCPFINATRNEKMNLPRSQWLDGASSGEKGAVGVSGLLPNQHQNSKCLRHSDIPEPPPFDLLGATSAQYHVPRPVPTGSIYFLLRLGRHGIEGLVVNVAIVIVRDALSRVRLSYFFFSLLERHYNIPSNRESEMPKTEYDAGASKWSLSCICWSTLCFCTHSLEWIMESWLQSSFRRATDRRCFIWNPLATVKSEMWNLISFDRGEPHFSSIACTKKHCSRQPLVGLPGCEKYYLRDSVQKSAEEPRELSSNRIDNPPANHDARFGARTSSAFSKWFTLDRACKMRVIDDGSVVGIRCYSATTQRCLWAWMVCDYQYQFLLRLHPTSYLLDTSRVATVD